MAPKEPLRAALVLLPSVVVVVELFHILPLADRISKLLETSRKSISVIRSRSISEHWKEKALVMYSRKTLLLSVEGLLYLLLLLLAFAVVFFLLGMYIYESSNALVALLYRPVFLIEAMALGTLYAFIRNRLKARHPDSASGYPFFSRVFHHLALGSGAVREAAFNIDSLLIKTSGRAAEGADPIYIAGLARAGTTIVLEALYSTGTFASLTYRDMPFVTAPGLWGRASARHRQEREKRERAHGDSLKVSYDSPEAFEEAFWLTFSREDYVRDDRLLPYQPDKDIIGKYRRYVGNIISSRGGPQPLRYLAKNNNNLLRIPALKSAFPEAAILVPFRDPVQHAMSLLRQHERFSERHAQDPFSLRYMNWLGHFEFGNNFKPLAFAPEALPKGPGDLSKPAYWLRYWKVVHEYVITHHGSDVVFLDYEELCENPGKTFQRLAAMLSVEMTLLERYSGNIHSPARHSLPMEVEPELLEQVSNVYRRLKHHAQKEPDSQ